MTLQNKKQGPHRGTGVGVELELDPVVDVNVRSENPVPLSSTHITIQHNQQQDEAVLRLSSCFEFHFFVQRTFSVGVRVNDYNILRMYIPECVHHDRSCSDGSTLQVVALLGTIYTATEYHRLDISGRMYVSGHNNQDQQPVWW